MKGAKMTVCEVIIIVSCVLSVFLNLFFVYQTYLLKKTHYKGTRDFDEFVKGQENIIRKKACKPSINAKRA